MRGSVGLGLVAVAAGLALPTLLLTMPDGSGPVLPIADKAAARLVSGAGRLAEVLALDPHHRLAHTCTHHAKGVAVGPESVVTMRNGSVLLLDRHGTLHRIDTITDPGSPPAAATQRPGGPSPASTVLAYVGPGRPLGFAIDTTPDPGTGTDTAEGGGQEEEASAPLTLLVADALKGLTRLRLGPRTAPTLEVLANTAAYVNDLAVGTTKVFFSSSTEHPVHHTYAEVGAGGGADGVFSDTMAGFVACMFRGDASGRLLAYDRATGATEEVIGGLWYANGVALSADERFVLVVETLGFRVLRHWLAGPRAGETDVFADRLPGFADGISRSADGQHFWLAVIARWTPLLKVLRYRGARGLLSRLGGLTRRFVKPIGLVLKLRASDGAIVDVLADPSGSTVAQVSAVEEHVAGDGGRSLRLGQLQGDTVVVCPQPP